MANYEAKCRSNYFRVKDEQRFRESMRLMSVGVWDDKKDNEGRPLFGIYTEGGGWPDRKEIDGEDAHIDLPLELQDHLADGEVAILMEVGYEKLRYVVGQAVVITPTETRWVNLHEEAMRLAREVSGRTDISYPEY